MRVIVGCEYSGVVRDAFRAQGHDAWSCDLLPCDADPEYHLQEDITAVLENHEWDLGIFHPPCTYMCSSGLHWNNKVPGRAQKTEESLDFVAALLNAPVPRIALENPIGCISTRICKPTQVIHPHEYGHDAAKSTCLWLKNLPPLLPTCHVEPQHMCPKCKGRFAWSREWCPECNTLATNIKRWSNQTPSGADNLAPSADRWKIRSTTYSGIAEAMAWQWSNLPAISSDTSRGPQGPYTVEAKSPAA